MKKCDFQISLVGCDAEGKHLQKIVSGLTDSFFGIYKCEDGKYSVTHLLSGMNIYKFSKKPQAVAFLNNLKNLDVDWDTSDLEILGAYHKKVGRLIWPDKYKLKIERVKRIYA